MARNLTEADRARMARSGVVGLSTAEGTALLDLAVGTDARAVVAMRLDAGSLADGPSEVPEMLRALAPGRTRRRVSTVAPISGLADRLRSLAEPERTAAVLELVLTTAAAVLGHADAGALDPDEAFTGLGFDSLSAVELRNTLGAATGLALPATLVFDFPDPRLVAAHMAALLVPDAGSDDEEGEDRLRRLFTEIPLHRLRDAGLLDSLLDLAGVARVTIPAQRDALDDVDIDDMDIDSLINAALDDAAEG
ncbi:MAG: hypothetical protein HOU81_00350 [Hamadaea sp.]|nr:hypothetical protein [Hamadaea sp.]NUT21120.1 hypothetical protein [Hamadaea sp.]